ncbi:MAG: D-threo-aldose 1-dehydrogenase [Gammaproteobacteria bacterium]|jgi:D-threo-aldose 1-dehydrogenase
MNLPRRELGRTGVSVTTIGLGGAPLGELFEIVNDAQADAVVATALEQGINFFDTAPWYGHGQSEHRIGRPLRTRTPSDYVLSTKIGRVYSRPRNEASFVPSGPWVGGLRFDLHFDYSAAGVSRSYEDSLQRLGVPRVDLLVIHDLDRSYHDDVTLAAHRAELLSSGWAELQALRANGDIAGIGAGINDQQMMGWFLDHMDLDFFLIAMPYTLLDQAALKIGMAQCAQRGIGVVIGAPFASGLLASGVSGNATYGYVSADQEVVVKARAIESRCEAHGVPLAAAALQFPLAHPCVAAVIPGATHPEMVAANATNLLFEIPDALWTELAAEELIHPDSPTPAAGWQRS